jgi:predicted RNase H-like HicB family nuclease
MLLPSTFVQAGEGTSVTQFTYTVIYEHDPETGDICASVPALDLGSHGGTLEEARAMIREALALHLEGLLEENMPIPQDVQTVERITVEIPVSTTEGTSA